MKHLNVIFLFATIIISVIFCFSCLKPMSETITDQNAGINGSFELVKNNLPYNWLVYTPTTIPDSDFHINFDSSTYKDGKQSLQFNVRKCSDAGGRFSPGISQEIPVTEGEEYKISCWIKNTGCKFSFKISGVAAFNGIEGPLFESSNTIEDWQNIEFNYKIPNKMKRLRLEISVLSPGTFWIDDVKIEK